MGFKEFELRNAELYGTVSWAVSEMAQLTALNWLWAILFAASAVAIRSILDIPLWARSLGVICIIVEVLFFLYGRLRLEQLGQHIPVKPRPEVIDKTFERFLTLCNVFPMEDYISGWFFGTPFERICKENVLEYVSYGILHKHLDATTPTERKRLEDFLEEAARRWNVPIREGHDPTLRYMQHIWEPLRVYHKPLLAYIWTEALARMGHGLLIYQGYQRSKSNDFQVWHLPPRVKQTEQESRSNECPMEDEAEMPETPAPEPEPRHPRLSPLIFMQRGGEAALDATLDFTARAAASVSAQYPHEEQQYHLPRDMPRRPRTLSPSPVRGPPRLQRNSAPHSFTLARGRSPAREVSNAEASTSSDWDDLADSPNSSLLSALPALRRLRRAQLPIVFLHGVGFGLLPYLHFLRNVVQRFAEHPVLLIEVPHVALRFCNEAVAVDDIAHAVRAALAAQGYEQAVIVGHSYGTFVASRFVQLFPDAVDSLVILDPVCMLVCYPQLLHNFIYRQPNRSNFTSIHGALDLVRFMCSRDLTISQSFCRKFNWSELMLWPHDLPSRSLVVLSQKDDLVPATLVQRQLESAQHPARVLLHPDLGHGGMLLVNSWQNAILDGMAELLNEG